MVYFVTSHAIKDEIVYKGWSEQCSMPQWIIDAWKAQYDDATVEQIYRLY